MLLFQHYNCQQFAPISFCVFLLVSSCGNIEAVATNTQLASNFSIQLSLLHPQQGDVYVLPQFSELSDYFSDQKHR
jgi:hypothetical protein